MMTMTRTARRPFRAAITENGLVPTKQCSVYASHGYYFGGSSSPSFVLVLAVTDDYVTYCDAYRLEVRREQRWIFEDLAAKAGETMCKAAAQAAKDAATADTSKAWGRLAVQNVKLTADRAAAHGAPVNLESYDRVRVTLVAEEGADVHDFAGSLGVIVSYDSDARTAVVECNRCDLGDFAKRGFASEVRWSVAVTADETIKECPRG